MQWAGGDSGREADRGCHRTTPLPAASNALPWSTDASLVVLAVLAMGSESSTGMIRITLAALPCRIRVLAAKAAVLTGVVLAAGSIAVLASVLAAQVILPSHGFDSANCYALLSLTDGPVLRAAAGSVLYLALIALMSLGVATATRDSAVAIGVVLALLYVFPVIAQVVTDPDLQKHLQQVGPMTAGLAIQATVGLSSLPISLWAGLSVLALWTAAALVVGGVLLRLRDAGPLAGPLGGPISPGLG